MAADFADDPIRFQQGAPARTRRRGAPVLIQVEHIGAGVWAKFTGTRVDGTAIVVSGAVVGGPDAAGDGSVYAVAVRDYRGNPDVVVYIGAGQYVDVADDPADDDAQVRHGIAPVFGPMECVELLEWLPNPRASSEHEGRWVRIDPVIDPTREQQDQFDNLSDPRLHVAAVHRGHLPIGPGLIEHSR